MPSSHGGGFGGGGSFRGGGGFSSGGSGNGPRFSTKRPFPGATRFYYIGAYGRPYYFYYSGTPRRQNPIIKIIPLVFISLFIAFAFGIILSNFFPQKLKDSECAKTGVYLIDDANIVSDENYFNNAVNGFLEETGIETTLLTLTESNFPKAYGSLDKYSLEDYAYDTYLNIFNDEGHYLIVFALYDNGEYLWLDMTGDIASNLIDDDAFKVFQSYMIKNLDGAQDKGVVIANALTEMQKVVFEKTSSDYLTFAIIIAFGALMLGFIIYSIISTVKQTLMINGYCDYKDKNKGDDFFNDMPAQNR